MKLKLRTILVGLATMAAASMSLGTARAEEYYPSRVSLAFDHLFDYDEMSKALHDLAAAYPELLTLRTIGRSHEDRDLWLVTVNNPRTGPDTAKPAMYIDGNIHGNEVQAAEVPLYLLWYLTRSYGKVESLTKLLDENAFYIVPMVNPDGRAHWFARPNTPDSSRSGTVPTDNDHDGLYDEDGPDDLDGDGEILQMRRRTPTGRWRDNPDDPRLMIPCKTGEPGQYERLGLEGIDNDGDGLINEDGVGGYDMNRNWPVDWQPDYIQDGSSEFPLCHPETRAIATFVDSHPNIAAVQAFHNAGGMILRGPGAQVIPECPAPDVAVYDHLGRKGEEMLPFYRYMVTWKDLYTVHGGFLDWTYEALGIFGFTNELWTGNQMFYRAGGSGGGFFGRNEDMMKFNDLLLFGQTFKPWKPFKHPAYGEIEIGGWVKFSTRVPPNFMLAELCHRNAAFCVFHAQAMPELAFTKTDVVNKGPGLWQITVEVRNNHVIPTIAAIAAQHKIGDRDRIEIRPTGAHANAPTDWTVLAGGPLADAFLAPFTPVEHQPERLWNDTGIGGEQTRLFRWIVRGSGAVEVCYVSAKARTISTTIELK